MVQRGLEGGQLRLLTRKEARDIHLASLEVLEDVGMRSPSEKILRVFEEAGAEIDRKDRLVKICLLYTSDAADE